MTSSPVLIGIAVVEYNGRYLVGRRSAGGPLAGYDEFPGGKCLPGESPRDCAVRECREETGLEVDPVELLLHREFSYPHGDVDLHFWLCRPRDADDVGETHGGFSWFSVDQLAGSTFPEANRDALAMLQARFAGE